MLTEHDRLKCQVDQHTQQQRDMSYTLKEQSDLMQELLRVVKELEDKVSAQNAESDKYRQLVATTLIALGFWDYSTLNKEKVSLGDVAAVQFEEEFSQDLVITSSPHLFHFGYLTIGTERVAVAISEHTLRQRANALTFEPPLNFIFYHTGVELRLRDIVWAETRLDTVLSR